MDSILGLPVLCSSITSRARESRWTTDICGSDQHMVSGRTTAPVGLILGILGHEITGEVVEVGRDVEFVKVGDIVSVPFNITCGRCRNGKEGKTSTSGVYTERFTRNHVENMTLMGGCVPPGGFRTIDPAEPEGTGTA